MKNQKDSTLKKKSGSDTKALKWIFSVSKGSWIFIIIYAILSGLLTFLGTYTAYGMRDVVNGATTHNIDLLKKGAIDLAILVACQLALNVFNRNMFERVKAKIEIKIRSRVFDRILHKNYAMLSKHHSGDLLTRLNSDVQTICNGIVSLVPNIVSLLTRLITSIVIMISLDPLFAVIFLAGGTVIAVTSRFFKRYLKSIHKKVQESEGKVNSFFQESLASILVIKVFNAYEQIQKKAHELQNANYKSRIKRATISIFANTGMSMAFSFGYLFAMILGAVRVFQGIIDVGEMTAILQLVNQISGPLTGLAGILPTYYGIIASAERIIEIEDYDDELEVNEDIDKPYEVYSKLKTIDFEHITFKYNRDLVFDDASISINKGDFAAITGISGIGKSTLLKLLLGVIYPESGEIKINTADGAKIADKSTRNLFSYVPQGNLLLSGTLRENITFMSEGKTDEEISRAIRLSCADEFVNDLPDGLDTVIGERGLGLSEGQVQRIAIARAILYDAPILLLDEATSALDVATERKVLKNLMELRENRTCIVTTHRPSVLNLCKRVYRVMDTHVEELDEETSAKMAMDF